MRRRAFIALMGGAAVWPCATTAQQAGMPVIGSLSGSSLTERAPLLVAFRKGLSESGYIEGQNVAIEYQWAEGQYDRLPGLATELARRQVAVIAALDGPAALAAKAATTTIPIVFNTGGDAVAVGLVGSLERPGGNLTGVNMIAGPLPAKQFGLLHEIIPTTRIIALLINPTNANAERDAAIVKEAARAAGRQILVTRAITETDFDAVFATLVRERAGALLVNSDVFFTGQRDRIIALAARHAIPVMAAWREWPFAGGLMSYGPSLAAAEHQVGVYTGKILKGAKPADLPIIQPTTFELVINLKTAKALALTIPSGVLAISDEVIE
jgi:putative tryptophan/tyrosine transport system substrate-binding protein